MKRSLFLSGVLLAVGAIAWQPTPSAPAMVLSPRAEGANCKPQAPVRVDLETRDLVGGRTRVNYTVTPILDAVDLDVTISFPGGEGSLVSHDRPLLGALQRGFVRQGSVAAAFPADALGAELEIQAHITIPDPDGVDGLGTYTTTQRVTWGEVQRIPEGVTVVETGGERQLSLPATRL